MEKPRAHLTRRERQIMDILHRRGESTVAQIMEQLPESPTSGAVRRMLNVLNARGAVRYRQDGARKVYRPTMATGAAGETALRRVVETFFAGSAEKAVACLFRSSDTRLSTEERRRLRDLIDKAREKGR
jgi:predicted transcriptional regulator